MIQDNIQPEAAVYVCEGEKVRPFDPSQIDITMKPLTLLNRLYTAMIAYDRGDPRRIQHFTKVHSYAKLIGELEGMEEKNLLILEAAALTHDIGIHVCEEKYGSCSGKLQEKEGPALAEEMMKQIGFSDEVIERVAYLIAHHHTYTDIRDLDYQILVEADFLVNLFEDNADQESIRTACERIFRTPSGKKICGEMFGM